MRSPRSGCATPGSFSAEMDRNESGGVQMETKGRLEAPLTNAKEAGDHSVEGEMQEKSQSAGDIIHNGE